MNKEQERAAEALGWQLTGEPVDLGVLEALSGPAGPIIGDQMWSGVDEGQPVKPAPDEG